MSFDRLKEIEEQFAALTKERDAIVADIGPKELLKAQTQQFFDAVTSIDTIGWKQFIPSFNDGDPCTFTVVGPVYDVPFYDNDNYADYDDDFLEKRDELWESRDEWAFRYAAKQTEKDLEDEYFAWIRPYKAEDIGAVIEFDKQMQKWFTANQGMLIDTFGYAEINIHRDGRISVGEYDGGW